MPVAGLALAVALALVAPSAAVPTGPAAPADTADVARRLETYLDRLEALGFSGSALVARGDSVLLSGGWGLADRESGRPWTATTPSTIGSITKPFTAAAIVTLLEAGRLSLDDSLPRFFDAVPPDKASVTVRELLTHSAGFPGAIGRDFEPIERDAFVRRALATPLLFPPGRAYEYSNVGYSLLGAIVEVVTGEGYEAYLRRAVLEPAGMARSGYRLPDSIAAEAAVGYQGGERWGTILERPWAPDGPGWHLRANGGLHASVVDLWRFARALDEGAIVSPAWRDSMQARRVPEGPGARSYYGFGWAIFETDDGGDLVAHDGGNGVFAADLRRYVDADLVVAAMSNVSEWSAIDVTPYLARIARREPVETPPAVAEARPGAAAAAAGDYALDGGGIVRVEAADGALVARPAGTGALAALAGAGVDDAAARGERALAAVRAADRGEYAPVAELFGGAVPVEEVAEQEAAIRRDTEAELGPRVAARLVGTALLGGRPTTVIELAHERGSRYLEFRWAGGSVGGIGVSDRPPAFRLHPAPDGSWFDFDPRSGVTLRARFGDGAVVFETPDGASARATRTGPGPPDAARPGPRDYSRTT